MISYILRRFMLLISTMFVLTIVIFWIHVRLNPVGDAHLLPSYLSYTQSLLTLNFGKSLATGAPIIEEMKLYLPASLELLTITLLLSILIGIPLGISLAYFHRSFFDRSLVIIIQICRSMPVYWLCQLLIVMFCISIKIFPTYGNLNLLYDIENVTGFNTIDAFLSHDPNIIKDMLIHLCLPIFSLTILPLVEITMLSRSATLMVLQTNFIKAVFSRGVSLCYVARVHILRNIIPAIIPHLNILLTNLVSSIILVEVIFEWPGVGLWVTSSVTNADYPVLESIIFVLAATLLTINILTEIIITIFFPVKKRVNIKL